MLSLKFLWIFISEKLKFAEKKTIENGFHISFRKKYDKWTQKGSLTTSGDKNFSFFEFDYQALIGNSRRLLWFYEFKISFKVFYEHKK